MDTKTGLNGLEKKYKTINCILIQQIAERRKIAIRGTYFVSTAKLCVNAASVK